LERLGYFASSTLVIVAGPSPTMSRIASSSLAPSQCTCFPKWVTKVPAGMATVLLGSNLLPVPTHHVPFSTVMKRSLGWKCGRLKLPAIHLLMTTQRPGFSGSPTRTALLLPPVPFQSIWSGSLKTTAAGLSSATWPTVARPNAKIGTAIARRQELRRAIVSSHFVVSGPAAAASLNRDINCCSLDHLVGAGEHLVRYGKAGRLRGL